MAESYGKKGTTIFLTTLIASVGLTQAILSFDLATMLTHLFTIIFGLIWGVFQMNKTEAFWTEEFLSYAKYIQKKQEEEASQKSTQINSKAAADTAATDTICVEKGNDTSCPAGGSVVLVSPDCDSPSCPSN